MKAEDSSSQPRVVTGEAAALLLDPRQVRYLEPFLGDEATISQVARQLGEPVNAVHYRVTKMLKLGLLEVKREQRRAGSPTKWYGSTAERFFAPFADSPGVTLADALIATEAGWQHRLMRGLASAMQRDAQGAEWGVAFFRRDDHHIAKRLAPHPHGTMTATLSWWNWWEEMDLSREEADNLTREFRDLLAKYRKSSTRGRGTNHLLRIAIAPTMD